MIRLIDAISYRKELEEEKRFHSECGNRDIAHGIEIAIADLGDAPTIEAKPVIHARWIWTVNGEADHEQYWVCSHCLKHTFYKTPFCSECGATMDLESEGTDE